MSTARGRKAHGDRGGQEVKGGAAALLDAARAYGTAVVMLHAAVAERVGLSPTELKTLDLLQRRGRLTAGEIASSTGLATASVTSLLDRLEHKKLVRRGRDAGDRRRVVVTVTSRLEATIAPLFESLNRRMLERCGALRGGRLAVVREFLSASAQDVRVEITRLEGGARVRP